jgi:hypothetical protein
MMRHSLTLADYPDTTINIACPKAAGQEGSARPASEHGPGIPLPDLRHVLAACPRRGHMHDPCDVVFPDLLK